MYLYRLCPLDPRDKTAIEFNCNNDSEARADAHAILASFERETSAELWRVEPRSLTRLGIVLIAPGRVRRAAA
jgi:hypothetical protein